MLRFRSLQLPAQFDAAPVLAVVRWLPLLVCLGFVSQFVLLVKRHCVLFVVDQVLLFRAYSNGKACSAERGCL